MYYFLDYYLFTYFKWYQGSIHLNMNQSLTEEFSMTLEASPSTERKSEKRELLIDEEKLMSFHPQIELILHERFDDWSYASLIPISVLLRFFANTNHKPPVHFLDFASGCVEFDLKHSGCNESQSTENERDDIYLGKRFVF